MNNLSRKINQNTNEDYREDLYRTNSKIQKSSSKLSSIFNKNNTMHTCTTIMPCLNIIFEAAYHEHNVTTLLIMVLTMQCVSTLNINVKYIIILNQIIT